MKPLFEAVIPLVPAGAELAPELAFYTAHLGFSVVWQNPDMAQVRRGDVVFYLLPSDNRVWIENSSYSIAVSDLDGLYAEFKDIPARVGPLEVKAWGRREFHLISPAGVCFQFFQRTVL